MPFSSRLTRLGLHSRQLECAGHAVDDRVRHLAPDGRLLGDGLGGGLLALGALALGGLAFGRPLDSLSAPRTRTKPTSCSNNSFPPRLYSHGFAGPQPALTIATDPACAVAARDGHRRRRAVVRRCPSAFSRDAIQQLVADAWHAIFRVPAQWSFAVVVPTVGLGRFARWLHAETQEEYSGGANPGCRCS